MPSARGSSTDQSIAPSTDNDTANRSDVKEQICAGGLRDPHWRMCAHSEYVRFLPDRYVRTRFGEFAAMLSRCPSGKFERCTALLFYLT